MAVIFEKVKGHEYAKYAKSSWDSENKRQVKKQIHLGSVVDKEKLIFRDRQGLFVFDENTLEKKRIKGQKTEAPLPSVKVLDFGDAWFFHKVIKKSHIEAIIGKAAETAEISPVVLSSLVAYYALERSPNSQFLPWITGSYESILDKGSISFAEGRVSDLLQALGNPEVREETLKAVAEDKELVGDDAKLILDSTGLPNTAQLYFTAVSTHAGKTEGCARLVFIVKSTDWMPLYYKAIPGKIVDKSTIENTVEEAKKLGFTISNLVFDAGYMIDVNMAVLKNGNIGFITRMDRGISEYADLKGALLPTLQSKENAVAFNERLAFIAEKKMKCRGEECFCYLCRDTDRQSLETVKSAKKKGRSASELYDEHEERGLFAIASSKQLKKEEVLPCYYARQGIEQIFDLAKSESNLLPLRAHSEDTMQGHLLVAFLATMCNRWAQFRLNGHAKKYEGKGRPENPRKRIELREAYKYLRNIKVSIYADGTALVTEPQKVANEAAARFDFTIPAKL